MKLTLPTWLTLLRIVMIPVLVLVFYLPYTWTNFASAAIFGLARSPTGSMAGSHAATSWSRPSAPSSTRSRTS
jgi:hypothetical protein